MRTREKKKPAWRRALKNYGQLQSKFVAQRDLYGPLRFTPCLAGLKIFRGNKAVTVFAVFDACVVHKAAGLRAAACALIKA
jgi:hypothetical protein